MCRSVPPSSIVDPLSSTRDRPVLSGSRSFHTFESLDTYLWRGGWLPQPDGVQLVGAAEQSSAEAGKPNPFEDSVIGSKNDGEVYSSAADAFQRWGYDVWDGAAK